MTHIKGFLTRPKSISKDFSQNQDLYQQISLDLDFKPDLLYKMIQYNNKYDKRKFTLIYEDIVNRAIYGRKKTGFNGRSLWKEGAKLHDGVKQINVIRQWDDYSQALSTRS